MTAGALAGVRGISAAACRVCIGVSGRRSRSRGVKPARIRSTASRRLSPPASTSPLLRAGNSPQLPPSSRPSCSHRRPPEERVRSAVTAARPTPPAGCPMVSHRSRRRGACGRRRIGQAQTRIGTESLPSTRFRVGPSHLQPFRSVPSRCFSRGRGCRSRKCSRPSAFKRAHSDERTQTSALRRALPGTATWSAVRSTPSSPRCGQASARCCGTARRQVVRRLWRESPLTSCRGAARADAGRRR